MRRGLVGGLLGMGLLVAAGCGQAPPAASASGVTGAAGASGANGANGVTEVTGAAGVVSAVASGEGEKAPPEPPVSSAAVVQLAVGGRHSCALHADGRVSCWGDGTRGQLGNGQLRTRPTPVSVAGIEDAVEIAASESASCARLRGGAVSCWGTEDASDPDPAVRPVRRVELAGALQLSGGCALGSDRQVRCWNRGPTVVTIGGVRDAKQISVGSTQGCAALASGKVACWGRGDEAEAVAIAGAEAVAVGREFACALLRGGRVSCWGRNSYGQLGRHTPRQDMLQKRMPPPFPPGAVEGVSDAVELVAGWGEACVKTRAGSRRCWGGWPPAQDADLGRARPLDAELDAAASIALGERHSCALLGGRKVKCWGDGEHGELGMGWWGVQPTPTRVPGVDDAVGVLAGYNRSCARRRGGVVSCWGQENAAAREVGGLRGAEQLSGGILPCLRDGSGKVRCTERGAEYGVALDAAAVDISVATTHSCAVLEGGRVSCWGSNERAVFGNGTHEPRQTPPGKAEPSFVGIQDATHIATGPFVACVLRRGGGVACAGDTLSSTTLGSESVFPTAVAGLAGATQLSAALGQVCALHGGRVSCWGFGKSFGEQSPPLQPSAVPGLTDAVQVSVGDRASCARRASGRILCWGKNHLGQLGLGVVDEAQSPREVEKPVEVPGLQDVSDLSVGDSHVCAVSRGAVFCWGTTGHGEVGTFATRSVSAPVEVRWPEASLAGPAAASP